MISCGDYSIRVFDMTGGIANREIRTELLNDEGTTRGTEHATS